MREDPKNSGSLTCSILIEAENVVTAGLKGLRECLDTLEAQDISRAEKVLLIENGQLTPETRESLRRSYPWLIIHQRLKGLLWPHEGTQCSISDVGCSRAL